MNPGISGDIYKSLFEVSQKLISKTIFPETLNFAYELLRKDIPFDRLCVAVADEKIRTLTAIWVKSETPITKVKVGYAANLKGGGLKKILETGTPRIINDLDLHLIQHPDSQSTKDILQDGMKSSLTFPLLDDGHPVGIIFFSSLKPHIYKPSHIDLFSKVAGELSLIVKHARLADINSSIDVKEQTMRTTIHDLRSPLGIIIGYLDLMKNDYFSQNNSFVANAFERLDRSCSQMMKLLEDLTEVYSLDKGLLLNPQFCSLAKLVEETVEQFSIIAEKKGIKLDLSFEKNLPANISIDVEKIRRVLSNLIDNAIKYTAPNTEIEIAVRSSKENVEIAVSDHGEGIPSHEMSRLFNEYGKTSTRPTAGESSTGLGLYIARLIVEAHHGQISAKSEPGKGSTFTFKLPNPFLNENYKGAKAVS